MEQHSSLDGALTLAPQFFFMNIGAMDDMQRGIENFEEMQARTNHYLIRAREILDKPRTGWTREARKIPEELWETVAAHMVKVSLACTKIPDGLMKWHKRRGEVPPPELVKIYFDTNIRSRLARK